jgi:hypothetical protein
MRISPVIFTAASFGENERSSHGARRGVIACVSQSPNSEACHEAHNGGDCKRLDRISPNNLTGFSDCVFQVMILDERPSSVKFVRCAFCEVFDRFRALLPAFANRGRGGMKTRGSLTAEVISLFSDAGCFGIEQRR